MRLLGAASVRHALGLALLACLAAAGVLPRGAAAAPACAGSSATDQAQTLDGGGGVRAPVTRRHLQQAELSSGAGMQATGVATPAQATPTPPCPRGYITVNGACVVCRVGTYSTNGNRSSCSSCPRGRSTPRAAWTSSNCPVCAAGFGGRTCTACATGFFSRGNTTAACRRCDCPAPVVCRRASCNVHSGCTTLADSTQQLRDCTTNGRRGRCDNGACQLALCAPFSCTSSPYGGKCGRGLDNGCGASLDCGCPTATTCSATGTGLVGTCGATTCSGLPVGGDAVWNVTCSGQAAGSNCNGTCANGFSGSPVASCGNDGAWTVSSGCAQVTCGGIPTGGNAVWSAACSSQAAGTTCNGTCVAGFTGTPAAACSNDGTWTVSSSCVQVTCNDLPDGGNATWSTACSGQATGTTCNGTCANGFTGTPAALCGNDGAWAVSSSCVQVTCNGLPDGGNATWSTACSGQATGTTCNGTCANGFIGAPAALCGNDGAWAVSSSCVQVTCIGLPDGGNATWSAACSDQAAGTICSGTCPAGFAGSPAATCGNDGAWLALRGCSCVPRTCGGAQYGGRCGRSLDDGCGGTIAQCSCADAFDTCSTDATGVVGVCNPCVPHTCSGFYAGRCGRNLDNGCGGVITQCGCASTSDTCSSNRAGVAGTCTVCVPRTCSGFYVGQCGTSLDNGCGGTISCGCSGTQACSVNGAAGVAGTCRNPVPAGCVPRTCSGYWAYRCGTALDDGCGSTVTCGCTGGQLCFATRPGEDSSCYLPSCSQSRIYCGTTYYGRCGSNLPSGCAGVGLNCPCPNPAHTCTSGSSGTAGFCRQMPRGTDGACIDAPDVTSVDTTNKAAVSALLASNFLPFQKCYLNGYMDPSCCNIDNGFPGNVDTCMAFTTSTGWQKETEKMVNFYRAMAGVPLVQFNNATRTALAAKAALIQTANGQLSRTPLATARCFTKDGHTGSTFSNLALGSTGPQAVMGYMHSEGSNSRGVGQRRLLLRLNQRVMASSDAWGTTDQMNYYATQTPVMPTNALWVVEDNAANAAAPVTSGAALARRFTSWPPPGFVPHVVVYPRWHISLEGFGIEQQIRSWDNLFASASVTMTGSDGSNVPLTILEPRFLNCLVWEPQLPRMFVNGTLDWINWIYSPPPADVTYNVTISNVDARYGSTSISYDVTIYDAPGSLDSLAASAAVAAGATAASAPGGGLRGTKWGGRPILGDAPPQAYLPD